MSFLDFSWKLNEKAINVRSRDIANSDISSRRHFGFEGAVAIFVPQK
jgi:hypothetical protein